MTHLLTLILLSFFGFTFAQVCTDVNEEYKECGTACPRTCANRNEHIICTDQCVRGCFCKSGYVKDSKSGKCVLTRDCPQRDAELCTDPDAVFKQCGTACPITCKNHLNPPKFCTMQCVVGCFCKSPYIKDQSTGKCVLPDACPPIATTFSTTSI